MHRRVLLGTILAIACAAAACSKPSSSGSDSASVATSAPTTASASITPSASASATAPPRAPKKYARVLHTGDSMVGGGLSRALGPKFEADGTKYYRDVIESGTIHEFSQNDHLPKLIEKYKPDLILISLGANHIPHSIDPDKEIGPFMPKLVKRLSGVDCYWIAPPIWKPTQAKFNQWLGERVAPCRFYDTQVEIERRPDKIHPNEKGGEAWADDFWKFMKGDGAFTVDGPTLAP